MTTLELVLLASPSVLLLGVIGAGMAAYGQAKHWQGRVDARLAHGSRLIRELTRKLELHERQCVQRDQKTEHRLTAIENQPGK